MQQPTYRNKRIIWERRPPTVFTVVSCFMFVVAALFVYDRLSCTVFWATILFFGGGGVWMAWRLFDPNILFVDPRSPLARQIEEEQRQERLARPGIFTYEDGRFSTIGPTGKVWIRWADIETIIAEVRTNVDERAAYDELCLDIFTAASGRIPLSVYTPGWHVFLGHLSENIPSIPKGWADRMQAAGAGAGPTLLFDKKGRPAAAIAACYPGSTN